MSDRSIFHNLMLSHFFDILSNIFIFGFNFLNTFILLKVPIQNLFSISDIISQI